MDLDWFVVATMTERLESISGPPGLSPQQRLVDGQGWSTLLAGALLLLISFTTNDGDDNLLQFSGIAVAHKIGLSLHLAALAALACVDEVFSVGVVELATRLRHRTANEAAAARERATRRTQLQDGCLVAHCRFLAAGISVPAIFVHECWMAQLWPSSTLSVVNPSMRDDVDVRPPLPCC